MKLPLSPLPTLLAGLFAFSAPVTVTNLIGDVITARRVLVWLLSLFGLAVLGVGVSGAGAATLPAAIYKGYGSDDGANIPLSTSGTISNAYSSTINPSDTGQFAITLLGAPSPFASAGADSSVETATASGQLFYYFEIVGGSGETPVNLDVTAKLSASSYGDGSGGAVMQIQQVSGVSFVYSPAGTACTLEAPCTVTGADWYACSANEAPEDCSGAPDSVTVSTKESLDSDTIYQVELAAVAGAPDPLVAYKVTGGGKGVVDPNMAIDPSTPDAATYSLAFSAGIGNSATPAVPEPSSWILLGVGFAGAGFFRFSRKRIAAS